MSKILLAVAIIFMIIATGMLANAAEPKGPEAIAGTENVAASISEAEKGIEIAVTQSSGTAKTNAQGNEYIIRAWGRYGPIDLCSGCTSSYRIYWGPLSFLGTPVVTDSLEVDYELNGNAVYSLGMDRGYITKKRFDARLKSHSGALTGAYINWVATRG